MLVKLAQAFGANILALLVSLAVTLLLPKFIGIVDYSFWQLYVFYMGYVGVLQFGWNDGVYLRFGGARYADLDKSVLSAQFWSLAVSQSIMSLAVAGIVIMAAPEQSRMQIGIAVAVGVTILGLRQFCSMLLQATGRIADYARVTASESITFLVLASLVLATSRLDLSTLILSDLLAKGVSLSIGIWACRDIVFGWPRRVRAPLREAWVNVRVGISLMLANLAGMLCIGIIRFGIERGWSIVEFGIVSLALSASNLMLVFFNSVSIVAFPALRRAPVEAHARIFLSARTAYVAIAFALLLLYEPIRWMLTAWLPAYEQSFAFLALLLPMIVFEGKTVFLTNTYLKTLRRERLILLTNLVSLALSVPLTVITVVWLHQLELAVLSILVVLVARGVLSEAMLGRLLTLRLWHFHVQEVCLAALFCGATWFLGGWQGALAYGLGLVGLLMHRHSAVVDSMNWLRSRLRRKGGAE